MKKNKIIKIILFTFFLLSLFAFACLAYYWHTDPEPICNRAGGFWDGVHGCDNVCDKNGKYCPDKIIFGCWCGLDKCWDGRKCIELKQDKAE
jgi:hypothetical protein